MDTLLENWVQCKIAEVAESIQYGYTASSTKSGTVRLLRITDIQKGTVDWDNVPFCAISQAEYEKFALKDNDIFFARTGATVGKSYLIETVPYKSVFASYLIRITTKPGILPKYVKYYFNSSDYWSQITENATGIGQPNVNSQKLKNIVFPLAPLPEQKRIVAKLDTLFAHLYQLKARLEKIPILLKQFRQAVLTQAVTGKLTEEWRKGKRLNDWIETTIGDVLLSLDQGWSPKCEPYPSVSKDNWGVIKTTSIQNMFFLEEENKQLPRNLKPRKHLELQVNDLLITRAGPRIRVGICCLVKATRPKLMICDKVYRLRLDTSKAFPGFIEILINSPERVEEIDALKTGISDSGLNLTQNKIKSLKFFNPTLEEQKQIVNLVESLFAIADRIEASYKTLQEKIDQLPQAILSKAFRGELTHVTENAESIGTSLERTDKQGELEGLSMVRNPKDKHQH